MRTVLIGFLLSQIKKKKNLKRSEATILPTDLYTFISFHGSTSCKQSDDNGNVTTTFIAGDNCCWNNPDYNDNLGF